MALAEDLRVAINSGLAAYEAVDGVGPDAYCASPAYHPMADGKCLRVLAVLHRSKLLSGSHFAARVLRICERLEEVATAGIDDAWSWGLGFSWRDLPATEPFLITSALIVRGALDCQREGGCPERLQRLVDNGKRALGRWPRDLACPVGEEGLSLPAYSPGICAPIYNAAAYCYATLKVADDLDPGTGFGATWQPSLEWIRSRRVTGLGWPYSPTNLVVDLLHQCYILNAMADAFGTKSVEAATAEMVGQFASPCCFADVIHWQAAGDTWSDDRDIRWIRPLGKGSIEVLAKPARLWSLGELLVVVSCLAAEGERSEAWLRLGRRIAESILEHLSSPEHVERQYPRHLMHALHGLGCYLALLRAGTLRKADPQSSPSGSDG